MASSSTHSSLVSPNPGEGEAKNLLLELAMKLSRGDKGEKEVERLAELGIQ